MSLEDLGNIGEFIAALGVIVSLIYLAVQIQRNTASVRTSTQQQLATVFSTLNMKMIDQLGSFDPDVSAKVQLKGLYDDNRLYRFLKQYDYKIVAFHVSYDLIRPVQADYLFRPWYDVSEFSQKEIAENLSISVENVKVRLHRARKRFKAILEEKCSFERDERNVLVCEPRD